ncbi:MAG: hypothetical protein ACLSX0_01260 [Anaerostipes caccae]|jgi:hypothetical protein
MNVIQLKKNFAKRVDKTPRFIMVIVYLFYLLIVMVAGGYAGDFWNKLKKKNIDQS